MPAELADYRWLIGRIWLARELARPQGEPGVVLIAPLGGQTQAIIARRPGRMPG